MRDQGTKALAGMAELCDVQLRRPINHIRIRPTSLNQATLSQTVAGATTRWLVKVEVHLSDLALNHTLRQAHVWGRNSGLFLATWRRLLYLQ